MFIITSERCRKHVYKEIENFFCGEIWGNHFFFVSLQRKKKMT